MKSLVVGILFVSLLLLSGCNSDDGNVVVVAKPVISSVSPNQLSRAEKGTAIIRGSNLLGASLVSLGDGVTIEGFRVVSSVEIDVSFLVNTNASAGKRDITVTTPGGTTLAAALLEVLNNRAPIVSFQVYPDHGGPNTNYTFDGLTSNDQDGSVITFEWDFGDGKTGLGAVVNHKYNTAGAFEVLLKVTDNDGGVGQSMQSIKVQEGTAPVAKFFTNPSVGDINTEFTFNAINSSDSDGSVIKYEWDFGNGNRASGSLATQIFRKPGFYEITLVVTDDDGLQNAVRKELNVGDFDEKKATAEIQKVVLDFFALFSKLDTLSTDAILVGWSDAVDCPGRAKEANVINYQKTVLNWTEADVRGPVVVSFTTSGKATAIADADFRWEDKNGQQFSGFATHNFHMRFETGRWQICDFEVIDPPAALQQLGF